MWLQVLQFLGVALFVGFVLYGFNIVNRWQNRHFPGPRPSWLFGNLGDMGPQGSLHLTLKKWAAQYGPIYVFFFGRRANIVVSDPDLIKAAAVRQFMCFHDRSIFLRAGSTAEVDFEESGMVLAKGKYWTGLRAACEPLFHQAQLASYAPVMSQGVERLVERLEAAAAGGTAVHANHLLAGMAMDITGTTVFGVEFDAQTSDGGKGEIVRQAETVFKDYDTSSVVVATLCFIVPQLEKAWSWLGLRVLGHNVLLETVAARTFLWGAAQTLVDNARAAEAGQAAVGALQAGGGAAGRRSMRSVLAGFLPPQRRAFERAGELYRGAVPPSNSLVDRLRRAVRRDTGTPLSDVEVCAQCYTFLLAGYETTSLTLSYTLYELAQHPHMQQRIRQEVAAVLKAKGRGASQLLDPADLAKLQFTEAAFLEAMRKYPPVTSMIVLARDCVQDAVLAGLKVPAGSRVMFDIWSLHHDPAHYPDPEAYRPERFLPGSAEAEARHPYAYIPFGCGPHGCIGKRFAMQEAVMALARLLQCFEFSLDPDRHRAPLELFCAATLQPRGGIWLRVEPAAGATARA